MNDVYHTSLPSTWYNYTTYFLHSISQPSFGVLTAVFQMFRVICGVTLCIWVMLLDVSEDRTEGSGVQEQFLLGIIQ